MTTVQQYIKQNAFNTLNAQSNGLDSVRNYSGPGTDWVVVKGIGRNRDTEAYDPAESNFNAALERLGGESDTVRIERIGHWGCGWFELIQIDPRDKAAIKIAIQISTDLASYPLLDDDDFYEREYEYQTQYAVDASKDLAQAIVEHFNLPAELATSEDMLQFAVEMNIECQRYYGNDSCINLYTGRQPDERDLERFATCVDQAVRCGGFGTPIAEFFSEAFNCKGGAQ